MRQPTKLKRLGAYIILTTNAELLDFFVSFLTFLFETKHLVFFSTLNQLTRCWLSIKLNTLIFFFFTFLLNVHDKWNFSALELIHSLQNHTSSATSPKLHNPAPDGKSSSPSLHSPTPDGKSLSLESSFFLSAFSNPHTWNPNFQLSTRDHNRTREHRPRFVQHREEEFSIRIRAFSCDPARPSVLGSRPQVRPWGPFSLLSSLYIFLDVCILIGGGGANIDFHFPERVWFDSSSGCEWEVEANNKEGVCVQWHRV